MSQLPFKVVTQVKCVFNCFLSRDEFGTPAMFQSPKPSTFMFG